MEGYASSSLGDSCLDLAAQHPYLSERDRSIELATDTAFHLLDSGSRVQVQDWRRHFQALLIALVLNTYWEATNAMPPMLKTRKSTKKRRRTEEWWN